MRSILGQRFLTGPARNRPEHERRNVVAHAHDGRAIVVVAPAPAIIALRAIIPGRATLHHGGALWTLLTGRTLRAGRALAARRGRRSLGESLDDLVRRLRLLAAGTPLATRLAGLATF